MRNLQDAALDYRAEKIIDLFNQLFIPTYQTCLIGGADEPIYLPKTDGEPCHRIMFTRNYFSSALHEIAHWCVAGEQRRLVVDFGYWYAPDGRSIAQQQAFERVEVKPQALEWIFSTACAIKFRVSADNLAQGLGASDEFKQAITNQVCVYLQQGMPSRALSFASTLGNYYHTTDYLRPDAYGRHLLD